MFYLLDKIDWSTYKANRKKEEKTDSKEINVTTSVSNEEIEELKKQNEKVIAAYKWLVDKYNKLLDAYKEEQKKAEWDLCSHLIFFYRKFQEWKKFVDWKAFGQAEYNKKVNETQDTTETIRPDVYARYNFTYWETEKSECDIVEEIIKKREEEIASLPF